MNKQCPAVFVRKHKDRKHVSLVFCQKDAGHDGLHKGFRKQWADEPVQQTEVGGEQDSKGQR